MTRSQIDPATLTLPEFDQVRAEAAVRELLIAIGENPERQGLVDHPGAGGKGVPGDVRRPLRES